VGLFAGLYILDHYFPQYRQFFCEAIEQTSENPIIHRFCSPTPHPPLPVPILLTLTVTLTAAALTIFPPPDKSTDIREQSRTAKTLENPAEPNRQEDVARMVALWRELSIRTRQFRIVVLMSLFSPILFFCFRGVDVVVGTHLLVAPPRLIVLPTSVPMGHGVDTENMLTLAAFGIVYSLLAVGVATFAVHGFSRTDFSRSQLAWRMAAGGVFYAGLTTLFGSILFAPTAWLTGWEYFIMRLTVAPILAGVCALIVVSRAPVDRPSASRDRDVVPPAPAPAVPSVA